MNTLTLSSRLSCATLAAALGLSLALTPSSARAEEWKPPPPPPKVVDGRPAAIAEGFQLGGAITIGAGGCIAFSTLVYGMMTEGDIETLKPGFITGGVVAGVGVVTLITALAVWVGVKPDEQTQYAPLKSYAGAARIPTIELAASPEGGSVALGWSF